MLLMLLLLLPHVVVGSTLHIQTCHAAAFCLQVCGIRSLSVWPRLSLHLNKQPRAFTNNPHRYTHTHVEQAAEGATTTTTARTGWPGCGRLLSDFNTLRMKIAKRQRHGVDNYPLIA